MDDAPAIQAPRHNDELTTMPKSTPEKITVDTL